VQQVSRRITLRIIETMDGFMHFTAPSRSDAKQIALADTPRGYLLLEEREGNGRAKTVGMKVGRAIINRKA